jgi:copper(I)-binding protein
MMRAPIAYALLAFAAAGLSPARGAAPAPVKESWDQTAPRASGAWVRLNPVPGRPSAGYLTVEGGGQPDKLIGATAPGARIELHSMTMDGGVMKMAKLDSVPLPAGGKAAFVPGGNHLMIFGLTGAPKTLPITLKFASGATVVTQAEVRAAAADPHAGH